MAQCSVFHSLSQSWQQQQKNGGFGIRGDGDGHGLGGGGRRVCDPVCDCWESLEKEKAHETLTLFKKRKSVYN